MKKKDMPVKLYRDGYPQGIFNNEKQAKKFCSEWEHEYYNQDEFDKDYRPRWQIETII